MTVHPARALALFSIGLLALFSCHTWFGPDTWFHLAWGRLILAGAGTLPSVPVLVRGAFACNQYWLYQAWLAALFDRGGVRLVTVTFVVIWVIIGALWARVARVSERPALGLPALLAFVACVQLRLEYRPETISFLCLIAMLGLFTAPARGWTRPALVAIEIVWANVHGYFSLGILVGAAAWAARPSRRAALLVLVLAIAPVVNPGGWRIVQSFGTMLHVLHDLGAELEELTPTTAYAWWYWPLPIFWAYEVAALALALGALRRREFRFAALVALGGVVLGVRSFRFVPLAMIMTAPLVGVVSPRGRLPRWSTLPAGLAALAAAWFIVTGRFHRWRDSATTFGIGVEGAEYPALATDFLNQKNFAGRVFNEPTDGGYLEFALPSATIAMDSSYNDAALARAYFATARDPAAFAAFDARADFDAAILAVENSRLVRALARDARWVVAHADLGRIVFAKADRFGAWRTDLLPVIPAGVDLDRRGYREAAAAWAALADAESDPARRARIHLRLSR